MESLVDHVVLPGDELGGITLALRLGAGLVQNRDTVVAARGGVLRHKAPDRWWVESKSMVYWAVEEDLVIGVVTARHGEDVRVDIGSAFEATLAFENFEGATKRNKPDVQVGDLVYARVTLANKDMDPELSCVNSRGKAGTLGKLSSSPSSYMFHVSTGLARSLLHKNNLVLMCLGKKKVSFELAIGMNGRVWVNSPSKKETIIVTNAIKNSEHLSPEDTVAMVNALSQHL